MHTYFIDTTDHGIDNYSGLLDIDIETRKLFLLSCPIEQWGEKSPALDACVEKIISIIDIYEETDKEFNIVLYADLLAIRKFRKIPLQQGNASARAVCAEALRTLFRYYVERTLINRLRRLDCEPAQTMIVFDEGPRENITISKDEQHYREVSEHIKNLLSLPEDEKVVALLPKGKMEDSAKAASDLCDKLKNELKEKPAIPDFFSVIRDRELKLMIEDCNIVYSDEDGSDAHADYAAYDEEDADETENGAIEPPVTAEISPEAEKARRLEEYNKMIMKLSKYKSDQGEDEVHSASIVSNISAAAVSKRSDAERRLRICLYLLKCVSTGNVFTDEGMKTSDCMDVIPMDPDKWGKLEEKLCVKYKTFRMMESKVKNCSRSFRELGLTPEMKKLACKKLGMDEHGSKLRVIKIEKNKKDKKKKKGQDKGGEFGELTISETEAEGNNILTDYNTFGTQDNARSATNEIGEKLKSAKDADEYIEAGKELLGRHRLFLKDIAAHIKRSLSDYSGKSKDNAPAKLPRRLVGNSAGESLVEKAGTPTFKHYSEGENENDLSRIDQLSVEAYNTALDEYNKACANRDADVQDITKQAEWYVNRIKQIDESLKTVKNILFITLGTILAVFAPYAAIQWNTITKSPLSIAIAAGTIALPLLLLAALYAAHKSKKRSLFREVWEKYAEKYDESVKKAETAVTRYDELLRTQIPVFRYAYEYKLDVSFFNECCRIANAKLKHHASKLEESANTLQGILSDLGVSKKTIDEASSDPAAVAVTVHNGRGEAEETSSTINYNEAFCTGNNVQFYRLIDVSDLN